MNYKTILYKRLEKYARMDTQSDPDSKTFPSSKNQLVLGRMLAAELKAVGVKNVRMDKYGYVTGEIPATAKEKNPVIGFLAHMDTSPDASGNISGQPALGLAANYGLSRPDVGAAFGSQFTKSGYALNVTGLPAGYYHLVIFAHSTISGAWNQAHRVVRLLSS